MLRSVPRHIGRIRKLMISLFDGENADRVQCHDNTPTVFPDTQSLHVLDVGVLSCRLHFPEVTELVIDDVLNKQSSPSSFIGLHSKEVFPVLRKLSVGPLAQHDPALICSVASVLIGAKNTLEEVIFVGEYGVAEILQQAYGYGPGESTRSRAQNICVPPTLHNLTIHNLKYSNHTCDTTVYMENKKEIDQMLWTALATSPYLERVEWHHDFPTNRTDPCQLRSEEQAIRFHFSQFGERFVWSAGNSGQFCRRPEWRLLRSI